MGCIKDEILTARAAQEASALHWRIKELHRELKQLTGTEPSQSRIGRSQEKPIACCYHAWLFLKVRVREIGETIYPIKANLSHDSFRAVLRHLPIHAIMPV